MYVRRKNRLGKLVIILLTASTIAGHSRFNVTFIDADATVWRTDADYYIGYLKAGPQGPPGTQSHVFRAGLGVRYDGNGNGVPGSELDATVIENNESNTPIERTTSPIR